MTPCTVGLVFSTVLSEHHAVSINWLDLLQLDNERRFVGNDT